MIIDQLTLAAVRWLPSATYVVKVRIEIRTGVVAQKYTQRASRYLRPFRLFSSRPLVVVDQSNAHVEETHNIRYNV